MHDIILLKFFIMLELKKKTPILMLWYKKKTRYMNISQSPKKHFQSPIQSTKTMYGCIKFCLSLESLKQKQKH